MPVFYRLDQYGQHRERHAAHAVKAGGAKPTFCG